MKYVKIAGFVVYLLFTALLGFSFGFADLGPGGESNLTRSLTTLVYFGVVGGLLGFFVPRYWKWSIVVALVPIFTLIMTLTGGVQYAASAEMT